MQYERWLWLVLAMLFFAMQLVPLQVRDIAARIVFFALTVACLWVAILLHAQQERW